MSLAWPTMSEGQWNLVATGVTTGSIERLKTNYTIWRTYVATGAAAPADAIKLKSPKVFEESNQEGISFQSAMDIYFWIENSDTDTDDTNVADIIEVST